MTEATGFRNLRTMLGVPLVREGALIGVLDADAKSSASHSPKSRSSW